MADDRGRYRKIYCRLWRSPDFRALDPATKTLTLYLLSGPQTNRIGLFPLSMATAAEDLDLDQETTRDGVARVCDVFGWVYDQRARLLWIPTWWAWNPMPANSNNWSGVLGDLQELPGSPLIAQFCGHLADVPESQHQLFAAAGKRYADKERRSDPVRTPSPTPFEHRSNTVPHPVRTQDQDQDQDQESTHTGRLAPLANASEPDGGVSAGPDGDPVSQVLAHYASRFEERYHEAPELGKRERTDLTPKVRRHGPAAVSARIDAAFDGADPWFAARGHELGAILASWNKLTAVARQQQPPQARAPTAWDQVVERVEIRLTKDAVVTWFRPLRLLEDAGDRLVVAAPNQLAIDWLRKHYADVLQQAAAEVRPGLSIELVVATEAMSA